MISVMGYATAAGNVKVELQVHFFGERSPVGMAEPLLTPNEARAVATMLDTAAATFRHLASSGHEIGQETRGGFIGIPHSALAARMDDGTDPSAQARSEGGRRIMNGVVGAFRGDEPA